MSPAQLDSATPESSAGKRRGRKRKRHTVGKVVLATIVTLGMVTGLGTVWLYRDLTDNLQVEDVSNQLSALPEKAVDEGPQEPLNILVMGSDTRDGADNNIDGKAGGGERSDTTILFHLSGDRKSAYGVSIPRDSLVTRPDCKKKNGDIIPGAENAMWNEAFAVGGPACTIEQFHKTTGVRVDHYVVVDFSGFKGMVDAIDGVKVCIPEDIDDTTGNIQLKAGTRNLKGQEALDYVRVRYSLGDGSDIGRVKRQQAFIAAMASKVVSGGVLARPNRLIGFLQSATESLTVDPGLSNPVKISKVGLGFQDIGLDSIKFITVPWAYDQREEFRGRVVWTEPAKRLWKQVVEDKPLGRRLDAGTIDAGSVPGSNSPSPDAPSGSPSSSPSSSPSGAVEPNGTEGTELPEANGNGNGNQGQNVERDEANTEALAAAGLCV